jgi:hypothetical protein
LNFDRNASRQARVISSENEGFFVQRTVAVLYACLTRVIEDRAVALLGLRDGAATTQLAEDISHLIR